MVEVVEVKSKKQKKEFARFAADMYRDVEGAVPFIVPDEYEQLVPGKNPALEFCDVKAFLAYKDGKCVGRIAAIINRAANEKWKTKNIRFSRVDFIDDDEVSAALFKAVEDYGRSVGLTKIQGPLGFTDQDQEGMLIEGFTKPGPFFTIYNAPYYKEHLERLGFAKDADWVEYRVMVPQKRDEKLHQLSEAVLKRYNLTLYEPKTKKEIKPYVRKLFELLNNTYDVLFGSVPLTPAIQKKYYGEFILFINPHFAKFINDKDGNLVGFGLGVPSLSKALKKSNGRLFPFGWFRLLTTPYRKAEAIDLYFIAVTPELQKKGLPAVLLDSMTETARKRGIKFAETGPELEDNILVRKMWKTYNAEQYKKRRCWIKDL